jgi:hypothetical protein
LALASSAFVGFRWFKLRHGRHGWGHGAEQHAREHRRCSAVRDTRRRG